MKRAYKQRLPILRAVARSHGYALGLHGSGERDLDLIAAPWVESASPGAVLVEALRASIDGFIIHNPNAEVGDYTRRNPHPKPHGRMAWAIHLHDPQGRLYIDVSVMPLQPATDEE
jgi:hypothetical protein